MRAGYQILLLTFAVGYLSTSLEASKRVNDLPEVVVLRQKVKQLREDIQYLQGSVKSLEDFQGRLAREIRISEKDFSNRFSHLMLPLLHWPKSISISRSNSWIEKEHLSLIVEHLRNRIVKEPLELIADRDLKLKQSDALKSDFAEALKGLRSKQSLLDLQIEELQQLEKRSMKNRRSVKSENSSGE